MEAGTPICGNCGQPTSGRTNPFRPLAESGGSLGAPGGPLAGGRGPLAALVKPLVVLLVIGGLGFALFGPAQDAIEKVTGIVDDLEGAVDEGMSADVPAPEVVVEGQEPARGYAGGREIAADLRKGGIRCRGVAIDASEETVESGSCTVRGSHVQMIVYRTQGTLEFAINELYGDDWPFAYVHDQNWFVSTTDPLARKIQRVLGGTYSVPGG